MAITAAVDNASETTGDLNKEAWDKYNLLRLAVLVEHDTDGTHLSTGDVVLKALFDANTILAANNDDTPAALTIAASRILGRASTGNIAALTGAQVATIISAATRALDNLASVAINTSLISDTDDTDDLGSAAKQWKDLYIDGTANIDALIADTADINGGTVDGITSLTAGGNLDIGAHGFTANTLTADGLTATRVVFAGAGGLLSGDSDMTFVTDTLTVTKLGAFQAAGAINFDSQNMTNVDIDSGTIDGITDLAVADGGTGSSTAANARTALGLVIGTNVLAQQTIGIANDNLMEVDDADAADDDFAKFTAAGLEGRSYSEVVSDLSVDTRRLENLCRNAAFASRSGGASAVPDEWTLEGTPTVAYDTVDTTYGDHAVKLTASGAGDEGIYQTLTHLKISTKYQVFARVKVDAGDTASLITTGATTNINTDSTSATWENIVGEFVTDASGTDVVIKLVASADTDVAYFCGITCVEGAIAPANFIRRVNETIFLPQPILSTSWDGDSFSTTTSTTLDLSAFGNGCPPKIKAVYMYVEARDSGSAANGAGVILAAGGLDPATRTNRQSLLWLKGKPDDSPAGVVSQIACDSNGDIQYYLEASGTDTLEVWLQITGYVLGE